ncbi:MAG: AAA+ family ATPase [Rhodobacterales bacterium]|nr:AAA+ family ATPase [Rhodobacterales bacterium]
MKRIAPLLLIALLAQPALAQEGDAPPEGEIGQGVDLLGEGARLFLRGLMNEVEPALRDLAHQLQNLNWNGIRIEDLNDYEPPEVLPNGDIILRRKLPDVPLLDIPEDGAEISL